MFLLTCLGILNSAGARAYTRTWAMRPILYVHNFAFDFRSHPDGHVLLIYGWNDSFSSGAKETVFLKDGFDSGEMLVTSDLSTPVDGMPVKIKSATPVTRAATIEK